jgi:hypothetical protein
MTAPKSVDPNDFWTGDGPFLASLKPTPLWTLELDFQRQAVRGG